MPKSFPTPEIAAGVAALIAHANKVSEDHWTERNYTHAKPPTIEVDSIGTNFARLIRMENRNDGSTRRDSVFCFVALKDGSTKELGAYKEGQIFRAASFLKPAKHARGCIWTDLTKVTPYGMAYLN